MFLSFLMLCCACVCVREENKITHTREGDNSRPCVVLYVVCCGNVGLYLQSYSTVLIILFLSV